MDPPGSNYTLETYIRVSNLSRNEIVNLRGVQMGSGSKRSNTSVAPSRVAGGSPVSCPERGTIGQAIAIDPQAVGLPGMLAALKGQVALVVRDSTVATANQSAILSCIEDGFDYAGVLEMSSDGYSIAFERI
jgi:hypothetical protein